MIAKECYSMATKKKITSRKKKKKSVSAKPKKLSDYDKARAKAFVDRVENSSLTKLTEEDGGLTPENSLWWCATLFEATGTTDTELGHLLLTQGVYAKFRCYEDQSKAANEILAALHEIRPQDVMEGMLAVQMIAAHNLAMECMKRSMIETQHPEAIHRYAKLANQFCRTFTAQLDALNKYRGKGQQKVTVEHVHVNEGGQAVVGNISQGGGENENK